jgi:hypothetical protein
MLGGRDFEDRALDPHRKVFARDSTDLDAPTLDLRFELRPVGEASGRHVEVPQQAAWREVVDVDPSLGGHLSALVSPVQLTPITG